LTIPKKSTQVNSGQRSTVNFDRTRRVHKGNSASLDVFTNSLGFPSYTSSTPPDSTSSTWKNRGATPTQLAESQEQLGESQLDSVHLSTLSNSPWLTESTYDSTGPLTERTQGNLQATRRVCSSDSASPYHAITQTRF